MSYTNGTTHYNLPQTTGSDKRDWADANQAFADVDAALYGAVQDTAQAELDIDALEVRMDTAEQNIADNAGDISALDGRLTTAEGTITQHTAQIADVRQDTEDMICAFNEASATSTHTYAVGDYFIYNDVLYRATSAIGIGDTIVPDTNCTTTNITSELLNRDPALIATVTSDGTKTYADILRELYPFMSIGDNLKIVVTNETTYEQVYELKSVNPQAIAFDYVTMAGADGIISFNSLYVKSNAASAYEVHISITTGTVTASVNTDNIPSLGLKFKLYKNL